MKQKPVQLFYLENCPYCKATKKWINEAKKENKKFCDVNIEEIEETKRKEYADSFDYYRVPTFYVDGIKMHEGACSKEIVINVLESALS